MVKYLLVFAIYFLSLHAQSAMWVAKNSWNSNWEAKYENWISEFVDKDFFLNANFETDCADAVIALRIIFARENSLPFLFTTVSGAKMSNLNLELPVNLILKWNDDKNFIKQLRNILDQTSSKTINNDAFPISLNVKSLRPGSFFIHKFENSGHVDFIHRIILSGQIMPIRMLSSTVPKKSRELQEYPFYFISEPVLNKTGFFKFKWAIEKGNYVEYDNSNRFELSLEQYGLLSQKSFDDVVNESLMNKPLSKFSKIYDLLRLLDRKIQERILIVQNGYKFCSVNKCELNSMSYYNFSTPSRDGNIGYIILQMTQVMSDAAVDGELSELNDIFTEFMNHNYELFSGMTVSARQIISNFKSMKYSSDPNSVIMKRWGLE